MVFFPSQVSYTIIKTNFKFIELVDVLEKPPKRNFLKENMASIKQKEMAIKAFKSNYLQGVGGDSNFGTKRKPKSASDSKRNSNKVITAEKPKMITVDYQNSNRKIENTCCRAAVETALKNAVNQKNKCKDMAVQTETSSPKRHEITSLVSSK